MNTKEVIRSQYQASLQMLIEAITKCPPHLWNDREARNKFWHISYHVPFYTHLYLQDSEEKFVPWHKHKEHYQFLGPLPWPPHKKPNIGEPYAKEEILEYCEMCQKEVEDKIPSLDLTADSGFSWLPFKKFELQLYNIRHIQHHTGVLIDRLRNGHDIGVGWIAMKHESLSP